MLLTRATSSSSKNNDDWSFVKLPVLGFGGQAGDISPLIALNLSSLGSFCVFDPFTIEWNYRDRELATLLDVSTASLIVLSDLGDDASSLMNGFECSVGFSAEGFSPLHNRSLEIQCASAASAEAIADDMNCSPKTKDIILLTSENSLVIEFDMDTNEPVFTSREDLLQALTIVPNLQYEISDTSWNNSHRLVIILDPFDSQNILLSYHSGKAIQVKVNEYTSDEQRHLIVASGSKTLRMSEHGNIKIFAVQSPIGLPSASQSSPILMPKIISNILDVSVDVCANNNSILPSFHTQNRNDYQKKSVFSMKGIFPISGNRPILVTHAAVPELVSSFSLFC
jgi:hypothetical protein